MEIERSIAGIYVAQPGEQPQFRGTGFLVSTEHVLTCAHVVDLHSADFETFDGLDAIECPNQVEVRFEGGLSTRLLGDVVGVQTPDLCLIRLRTRLNLEPVRLLAGVQLRHRELIVESAPIVVGFDGANPSGLAKSGIAGVLIATADQRDGDLRDLQLAGGVPPGMSGAPLLLEGLGGWVCIGMLYLGGRRAGNSRAASSDEILRFLARFNVQHLVPFNAAECLARRVTEGAARALGTVVNTWRRKKGLHRKLAAEYLGVKEALLTAWEEGRERPPSNKLEEIAHLIILGDPAAVDEWIKVLARIDPGNEPEPSCLVRAYGSKNAVKLVSEGTNQSVGRKALPRFRVGSLVRLQIDLPWPAHITVFNVVGMESPIRLYDRLDSLLACSQPLPAGSTLLPNVGPPIQFGDPTGQHCIMAFARRYRAQGEDSPTPPQIQPDAKLESVSASEVLRALQAMDGLPANERLITFFDYKVIER